MINIWFTSDHHFGHANILKFEPIARPFSSLEEMHEVMIERWNNIVHSNDIVYHLGDFCFGQHNIRIAERLNGKKKIILGNHDKYPMKEYIHYFEKIYGVLFYNRCILSHVPVHKDGLGARWLLNVHGHKHSKTIDDPHYFNVSVEQNNLYPFHWDQINDRLKQVKNGECS